MGQTLRGEYGRNTVGIRGRNTGGPERWAAGLNGFAWSVFPEIVKRRNKGRS